MQTTVSSVQFAAVPALRVDVALVLAIDCSSSVDEGDFRMQMDGIATALRNPLLAEAIASGSQGLVALSLVQWSSRRSQAVTIPWRLLAGRTDLEKAAQDAENAERDWDPGGTGLAAAVDFSMALLQSLPIPAGRLVIDVSGDGKDNEDGDPAAARDRATRLGITVNGLPIINGSSNLESYYRRNVIGGPGAFILAARDMRSFSDAMTRKLLREVASSIA